MSKLKELIELCKASVTITVNDHRDSYTSVEYELAGSRESEYLSSGELAPEIEAKMIELDSIVTIHFYPDTPVGFATVWHYDVDLAIEEALNFIKKERDGSNS